MSPIISDVVLALDNIEARFFEIEDVIFSENGLADLSNFRRLERRFMTEFSIQYEKNMNRSDALYQGVEYDFEVPKKFMWYANPDIAIRKTWQYLNDKYGSNLDMLNYFETQPDFLVHACQTNMEYPNQKLIIESKTNPNTSIGEALKDIFHIFIYANKYNFQHNVLMLVNIDINKWKKWMKEYVAQGLYLGKRNRYDNIYLIYKADFGAPTEVRKIADIMRGA